MVDQPAPKRRIRRRRRRRTQPTALADSLAKAFERIGLTDQARRLRILAIWPSAVGEAVAERTEVQSFSRGVLTVRSQSAAWRNELTFLKRDLLAQLNAALGSHMVHELRIVSGRVQKPAAAAARKRRKASTPVAPRDRQQAAATASTISDPEVREAFARMMAAELTWKRDRRE